MDYQDDTSPRPRKKGKECCNTYKGVYDPLLREWEKEAMGANPPEDQIRLIPAQITEVCLCLYMSCFGMIRSFDIV